MTPDFSLLAAWLFQDAGATRVQTGATVTNGPMRRLLEKLGFIESGTVEVQSVPHVLYAVEPGQLRRAGRSTENQ